MSTHRKHIEERLLAESLRLEAHESRPVFSESLHRRIIRSVEGRRTEATAAVGRSATVGRRRRGTTAVLAAACALAAVMIGWRLREIDMRPGESRSPLAERVETNSDAANWTLESLPPIDALAEQAATELEDLLASAGIMLPSTQLSHDARLAADALLQRLPVDMKLAGDPLDNHDYPGPSIDE